jgi:hypothetical protein
VLLLLGDSHLWVCAGVDCVLLRRLARHCCRIHDSLLAGDRLLLLLLGRRRSVLLHIGRAPARHLHKLLLLHLLRRALLC